MYSLKSLLIAALLSTVIATPLRDRATDDVDGPTSLETRGEPPVDGGRGKNDDYGCGDKGRLDSEIRNREELKERLDVEIRRREEIKERLDEEIRKKQNGKCGW